MLDWLWWVIDQIASEYGGGPKLVMATVYLDEAIYLIQKIKRRRVNEYLMLTSIATFPHLEKPAKKEFINSLKNSIVEGSKPKEFDRTGFEALKFAMSQNPRIIVKN
jgi:hypothetical protein